MSPQSVPVSRSSMIENRERSCTDWPCLLIFIVFMFLYILFTIFVFREGSINRFINPTDTEGQICGVESQMERQYLQFFDIVKCVKYILIGARCPTPQICVEKCPSRFYHYKILYAQELQLTDKSAENIQSIRAQLSCRHTGHSELGNPQISIYSLVKERQICAPYALPSVPIYGRCVPSIVVNILNATIREADTIIRNHGGNISENDHIPSKDSIKTSLQYFKKALQLKRLLSFMIDDLIRSRYVLLLSLLASVIILIIYMISMRYVARYMIWILIIFCIVAFASAACLCFLARARMVRILNHNRNIPDLEEMNITFDGNMTELISQSNWEQTLNNPTHKFDTAMILLDEFTSMSTIWLVLGIISSLVCVLLLIVVLCLSSRINLAAALIEEASTALCQALSVLLWPLVTFFLNVGIVAFGILVLAHYSTLGKPIYQISCSQDLGESCQTESTRTFTVQNQSNLIRFRSLAKTCLEFNEGDYCSPENFAQLNCTIDRIRCVYVSFGFLDEMFDDYFNPEWSHHLSSFLNRNSWVMNIFNMFMIYWLLAFTVAFEEMALACTFASYYWTLEKTKETYCRGYFHQCLCLQGVKTTIRYHTGTIAFGSSILAIIDVLRTIVDLIKQRMESLNLNNYGRCCFKLMDGCLQCVRRCFQFFSRYTYIMTAISGKWFCASAFTATRLLLSNCLRVFVLDRICSILLYIGRLAIAIASCLFAAYLLDELQTSSILHFSWFPVLIIGIIVYITSAIFLKIYSTAASTLFFCVIYDLERYGNPQMETHFMSNRLKIILNESDDFSRNQFQAKSRSPMTDQTQSQF